MTDSPREYCPHDITLGTCIKCFEELRRENETYKQAYADECKKFQAETLAHSNALREREEMQMQMEEAIAGRDQWRSTQVKLTRALARVEKLRRALSNYVGGIYLQGIARNALAADDLDSKEFE